MNSRNEFYQDDAEQPSEAPEIHWWPSILAITVVGIICYAALCRPANGATLQLDPRNAAQVAQQLNRSHSQARVELVGGTVIIRSQNPPLVLRPWDVVEVGPTGFKVRNYAPYVGIKN